MIPLRQSVADLLRRCCEESVKVGRGNSQGVATLLRLGLVRVGGGSKKVLKPTPKGRREAAKRPAPITEEVE